MKRVSLEISGRIDEVPEDAIGVYEHMGDGEYWTAWQPAADSLLSQILEWAEHNGALATVMVRLADDATGGDDE